MKISALLTLCCVGLGTAFPAAAQQDIRTQLLERGAPAEFADRVDEIVRGAERQGLPVESLHAKALEGWAKRAMVPQDRVVTALQQRAALLLRSRNMIRETGIADPPGRLVSSAATGMGRGLTPEDVRAVIEAAPSEDGAANGLQTASSLAAQGLDRAAAVRAVTHHFNRGGDPAAVLELPSAVSGMTGRGIPMSEIARAVMEGRGISLPGTPGRMEGMGGMGGNRPAMVPPSRGDPDPGQRGGHERQGQGQQGGQSGRGGGNTPRPL